MSMSKKEIEQIKKGGIILVGGLLAYKLIKPLANAAGSVSNTIATSVENAATQKATGLSSDEIKLASDVANKVKAAMFVEGFFQMSWFGGSTEDEAEVIAQLNRLSTFEQAQLVSDKYRALTGNSLATDLNKYLDSDDRNRIKSDVLAGCK